jgi:hypothetical protein
MNKHQIKSIIQATFSLLFSFSTALYGQIAPLRVLETWANGHPKTVCSVQEQDSTVYRYYESGKIKVKGRLPKGKSCYIGALITWYENGQWSTFHTMIAVT